MLIVNRLLELPLSFGDSIFSFQNRSSVPIPATIDTIGLFPCHDDSFNFTAWINQQQRRAQQVFTFCIVNNYVGSKSARHI